MPPGFSRLTPEDLRFLRKTAGEEHVLESPEDLEKYGSDETEDFCFPPEAVVRPRTAAEIAAILTHCTRRRIPVTPRGAGTGLSGGALPVHGGVVLTLERMNAILEIDRESLFAVVEPGVIVQVLQEAVEKEGLFYPPDPASRGSCLIGGNVAHNAGGPRAVKYGVTKDYVYGLEAVLPTGETIRTGGKLLKNVAGYNLTQLLVGSEGTLAIVTKITLKLIPLPKLRRTLLVPFASFEAAGAAVAKIFQAGVVPCAVELMEQAAIRAAERKRGLAFPHSEHAALLLLEVDGNYEVQVDGDAEKICAVCLEAGAVDVFLADSPDKREFVWNMRRSIGEAVKAISPYREEDLSVPRAAVPEAIRIVKEVAAKHRLDAITYGHAGDGNLHVNILKRDLPQAEWDERLPAAVRELFEKIVALGGTITGEHGVGYVQRDYLPLVHPGAQLALLKKLKAQFDPAGILNPGKLWPE